MGKNSRKGRFSLKNKKGKNGENLFHFSLEGQVIVALHNGVHELVQADVRVGLVEVVEVWPVTYLFKSIENTVEVPNDAVFLC